MVAIEKLSVIFPKVAANLHQRVDLHNRSQWPNPPLCLTNSVQHWPNLYPWNIPILQKIMMKIVLQVFSTISTCTFQVHTSFYQTSLYHHQGCVLRNLQGWKWEGQAPTWYPVVRKIMSLTLHCQHNYSILKKPTQLPIKYLELPGNINIWSKVQTEKFGNNPLQMNWDN